MIHVGDITKLKGSELEIVDCITGGSPCQDLSVAGKRAGLDGERSGLFMEQIRVIKEMREYDKRTNGRTGQFIRPRYMVWENVPGAFSSNGGEDFRVVLEETAKVAERDARIPRFEGRWPSSGAVVGDGWSIAWRVHDAQYWGVPQRRKRISLVADFGGGTAPEVLFERKGLSGDIEQGRETRKSAAGAAGEGAPQAIGFNRERCGAIAMDEKMPTLQAAAGESGNNKPMVATAISFQERAGKPGGGKGILIQGEHVGALSTLNNQSVFCLQGNGIDRADTAGCNGKGWTENISYTLNTIDRPAVAAVCAGFDGNMGAKAGNIGYRNEQSPTLNAGKQMAVVLNDQGGSVMGISENVTGALRAQEHGHQPLVFEPGAASRVGGHIYDNGITGCLRAALGDNQQAVVLNDQSVFCTSGIGVDVYNQELTGDIAASLTAACGGSNTSGPKALSFNNHPIVCANYKADGAEGNGVAFATVGDHENRPTDMTNLIIEPYQVVTGSLCASGYSKLGTQEAANDMYVVQSMETFHCTTEMEKVQTLKARDYKDPQIVVDQTAEVATYGVDACNQTVGALCLDDYKGPNRQYVDQDKLQITNSVVRRLTPLECERLQGFPDDWTDIGEWTDSKGKLHKPADSPRYKALGNSIALPFWFWLLRRISAQYERPATLGSLFDGIGGFPLCWEKCNGTGTARWASEIEEFPIAVTKRRFPQ